MSILKLSNAFLLVSFLRKKILSVGELLQYYKHDREIVQRFDNKSVKVKSQRTINRYLADIELAGATRTEIRMKHDRQSSCSEDTENFQYSLQLNLSAYSNDLESFTPSFTLL